MKLAIATGIIALMASAAQAGSPYYGPAAYGPPPPPYATGGGYGGCPVGWHAGEGGGCICDYYVNFYPGYPSPPYNVHLSVPGVRVVGAPVNVPSGAVYVEGPPVYVQAPPVHVASPQVYLQRPRVVVQPSQVTVEPPTVHVADCPEGSTCEMVGQSYGH